MFLDTLEEMNGCSVILCALATKLYWLYAFFLSVATDDIERLMLIVYDERHLLPNHAHTLAGRAALRIVRRHVAHRYLGYRILRDASARFKHVLYDIWLLRPELRPVVDELRREFATLPSPRR